MDIEKLRQKILDLAIRGKLVPQDPNDEPASVLIERIREEKAKLVKEGKIKASKEESYIYKGSDNCYYEKIGDNIKNITDEIPFDIPNNWMWCRLSSIGTTNIGLTYNPKNISTGGTIVLRSSNIRNNKIDLNDLVRVSATVKDNQYIKDKDILICSRNGSKKLVGKCAIFNNINNEKISFGAFMAIFRTPFYKYVYHFFTSKIFRDNFENDDNKQINQVTQDILKKSLIPIPPLDEQYRILNLLENTLLLIDKISTDLDDINNLILAAKNKILESIFAENSSYKSYYKYFGLGNLCKLENGIKQSKGDYPYLNARTIRGRKNPEIRNSGVFVNKNQYVILVDGENSGEIMITPFDGYLGSTFKILSFDSIVIPEFIALFITYHKVNLRSSKTGSAIPHLNKNIFKSLKVGIPNKEIQSEIILKITNLFTILEQIIS